MSAEEIEHGKPLSKAEMAVANRARYLEQRALIEKKSIKLPDDEELDPRDFFEQRTVPQSEWVKKRIPRGQIGLWGEIKRGDE